jgi:hypothetical protein
MISAQRSFSIKEGRHLAAPVRQESNDGGKMPPHLDRSTLTLVLHRQ